MPLKIKTKAVKEIPAYNDPPATDAVKPIKKTKAELLEELEEVYEKAEALEAQVDELEKELEELEECKRLQESADKIAQMRDAFVNAGFSKQEAFALVRASIEGALSSMRK